jgi:C4-type Zn-finger protein
MEAFEPCPTCLSHVDIVLVKNKPYHQRKDLFIVNCKQCGFSTSNAYASLTMLKAVWNALAGNHI